MSLTLKIYLALIGLFFVSALTGLGFLQKLAFWGIVILTVYYAIGLIRKILRKFLWRIRRKLVLSYIFIGFIPLCLLASIFVLAFWIFMGQATTEMFNSAMDSYLLQTKIETRKLLYLTNNYEPERAIQIWDEDISPQDSEWMKTGLRHQVAGRGAGQSSVMVEQPGIHGDGAPGFAFMVDRRSTFAQEFRHDFDGSAGERAAAGFDRAANRRKHQLRHRRAGCKGRV
jgi:hypothetical protein